MSRTLQRSYNILLVEDNPSDVEIILEAFRLSQTTHRVSVCRAGEDALDYLFQKGRYTDGIKAPKPDMMLLDLNLPRRNGFDVLEQVKRNEFLYQMPVIVLTTSDHDEDVRRCFRLGANN